MSSTTSSRANRPVVFIATALFVIWLLMDSSIGDYMPFGSSPAPEAGEFQDPGFDSCGPVRQSAREAMRDADEVPEDSLMRPQAIGHAALIISQNPECFDSQVVANANDLLYGGP